MHLLYSLSHSLSATIRIVSQTPDCPSGTRSIMKLSIRWTRPLLSPLSPLLFLSLSPLFLSSLSDFVNYTITSQSSRSYLISCIFFYLHLLSVYFLPHLFVCSYMFCTPLTLISPSFVMECMSSLLNCIHVSFTCVFSLCISRSWWGCMQKCKEIMWGEKKQWNTAWLVSDVHLWCSNLDQLVGFNSCRDFLMELVSLSISSLFTSSSCLLIL